MVLVPVLSSWFASIAGGRQKPTLFVQVCTALQSLALGFSVVGNSENRFSLATVVVGVVVAVAVAGERALSCQAFEKVSESLKHGF